MYTEMRKSWHPKMSALIPAVLIHTLCGFGGVLLSSAHVYLVEQAVCREHYMLFDSGRVGINGLMDEEICKLPEIEARVANIYGIYCSIWHIPTLFLAGPYGQIGSLLGKRTVIFMNLTSFTVASAFFVAICYFHQTFDIRWIYLAPFFDIFGGGRVILASFLYTYISESTNSKRLSRVLYNLSAVTLLVNFLALTVSSFTLRRNVWLQCIMGIGCSALLIPLALLLPDSRHPPPELLAQVETDTTTPLKKSLEPDITETTSLLSSSSSSSSPSWVPLEASIEPKPAILPTLIQAFATHHKHTLSLLRRIFTSPPFARITLLTYFFLTFGLDVTILCAQWASMTYSWIFADIASLTSFEMVESGLLLISLPSISKFLAQREFFGFGTRTDAAAMVDLFIVKISVLLNALGLLLMSFAPSRQTYVGADAIYMLGCGVKDALRSFVTARVGTESVGELYLAIGMVETIGGMMATVGWSRALAFVLGKGYWLERMPFVAATGVLVGVFGCVVVLGRVERDKEDGGHSDRDIDEDRGVADLVI